MQLYYIIIIMIVLFCCFEWAHARYHNFRVPESFWKEKFIFYGSWVTSVDDDYNTWEKDPYKRLKGVRTAVKIYRISYFNRFNTIILRCTVRNNKIWLKLKI